MTQIVKTRALDGTEIVVNSGMPFHGPTYLPSLDDGGVQVIGHADPIVQQFGRLITEEYHYPIRFENRAPPWDHYMSHIETLDMDNGPLRYACQLPCARNNTGEATFIGSRVLLGVPFSLNGKPAPSLAAKVYGENTVLLSSVPRKFWSGNSVLMQNHVEQEALFPYDPGSAGCQARYLISGQEVSRMLSPAELEIYQGQGMYQTRNMLRLTFIDAHDNKAIFAVTPRYNLYAPDGPSYWAGNNADAGRLMSANQVGMQIICLIEVERLSDDLNDTVVRVLKTAKECEGDIERTEDPTVEDHGTHTTYHMKTTQTGAVLDAWYGNDGQVKYRLYDAEYEFSGTIGGAKVGGVFYECHHTNRAKVSVSGMGAKEYIQTLTHEVDDVPGWTPGTGGDNTPPRVTVTNRITEDGVQVAEDVLEKVYVVPTDFITLAGRRAPFGGPEVRAAAFGFGVGYPGHAETYNPHTFSLFARNNGAGTCVMYGVVETFRRHPDSPVIKTVSKSVFASRDTVREFESFVDVVEFEDPRYLHRLGEDRWRERGYAGNKLFATINLMTGELYDMGIDDPLGHTNWR